MIRTILRFLALCALTAAAAASAQSWPDKATPIKLVVPFGAGTSTDTLARAIGRGMADVAGVNVIVDNKPGGDAIIGVQAVKQAAADGYTILLTSLSSQVVTPHMHAQLPYDPLVDFVPLVGVAKTPLMFNVGPSLPFKTVREFVAAARANPGKYTVGSSSPTTKLMGEMFARAAGIELLGVPYKNFSDAMVGLAAGQIDIVIVDAATAGPFYKQGVRPIATTAAARTALHPNVPTMKEEGLADFEIIGWFAAFYPAKTPPAAVVAMRDMFDKAMKTKHVTDVYGVFAMEPMNLAGDDLDKFQRAEFDKWGKAVRAANMGPQK